MTPQPKPKLLGFSSRLLAKNQRATVPAIVV
jgi:hypothetical protein